MATFGLWAIQNSQRGRARARGGACHPAQKHAPETMRTWKSNRSPLRVHWSSLANTATFLLWAMQKSQRGRARARAPNARARGGVCVVQHRSIHQKLWQLGNQIGRSYGFTLVSWPTWRPFLLWAIQNSQRGRARARRGLCRPAQKHTLETMLTWKSDRSPLRVHFSFQANMATFLLWAIQNSQRGRARARSQRARARAEGSVSFSTETYTKNYGNLEIRPVAVKGSL